MRPHVFLALMGIFLSLVMLSITAISIYATVQVFGGLAAFNLVVVVPALCTVVWAATLWGVAHMESRA